MVGMAKAPKGLRPGQKSQETPKIGHLKVWYFHSPDATTTGVQ